MRWASHTTHKITALLEGLRDLACDRSEPLELDMLRQGDNEVKVPTLSMSSISKSHNVDTSNPQYASIFIF